MSKLIGITGGIGSGKSTITKVFESMGVPIYIADERAKWLNEHDETIRKGLTDLLGEDVYEKDGKLNKPYMAQRIFSDKELLKKVNGLIHPRVFEDFKQFALTQHHPYIIIEAAVMIENNFYRQLDGLIVVSLPEEDRIERTMLRDGATRQQIAARIANQIPQKEMEKHATWILTPDDRTPLLKKIIEIDNYLTGKK